MFKYIAKSTCPMFAANIASPPRSDKLELEMSSIWRSFIGMPCKAHFSDGVTTRSAEKSYTHDDVVNVGNVSLHGLRSTHCDASVNHGHLRSLGGRDAQLMFTSSRTRSVRGTPFRERGVPLSVHGRYLAESANRDLMTRVLVFHLPMLNGSWMNSSS